ncbi:hypothetical protein CR51_14390 [Caballeronia megalochromosomata]|jgi:hypothetical protein|nr:hypothetical protein CR51_14390 [Caballeronia megalochromosomata]
MSWPVLKFEELPAPQKPSPWLVAVCSIGVMFAAAVVIFVSWPKLHEQSGGIEFWLCLVGIPLMLGLALWCAILHFAGMAAFGVDCLAYYTDAVLLAWQRWGRQYAVLGGFSVLLVEDALAEKIAGLSEAAPRNKSEVRRLEEIAEDFKSTRTEQVLERLLRGSKDAVLSSGIDDTLRIIASTGEHTDAGEIEQSILKQWDALNLRIPVTVEPVSEISWPVIERSVIDERTPVLLLSVQLHDNGDEFARFTESAVALLFQPNLPQLDSGAPVVRIYRSMPASTASMLTDFQQLGESGAVPLARIRTGWNCNLGKADGYALSRAVGDCGLVLEGGTSGMVNVSDSIGPVGPISPWISLALAAELVQYGQGPQLLASQEGKQARLYITCADEPASSLRMGVPPLSASHTSVFLVGLLPIFTILFGVLFKAADLFPWVAAGVAGAMILALALRLLHPGLVQMRAMKEVEALGGRLPPLDDGQSLSSVSGIARRK